MCNINWVEVIGTLASVATAVIALLALRSWQRQDRAKREAEFLDALIEAAHAYLAQMPKPVTLVELAKIGMASHTPTWEEGEQTEKEVKGAIAYIEKYGERDGKRLAEALEAVRPSIVKLRSLTAKGQVFNFHGYAKCQNAVAMLTWQFDRIEAVFMATVRLPNLNWDHPEVSKSLKNAMAIDTEEIHKSLAASNIAILEFSKETYKRIYG